MSSFNGVLCNAFIEKFLQSYCKYFQGVYSSNTIPQDLKNKETFSIVVNLSRNDESGSHFITILKHEDNLFYLDSLKLPPKEEILNSVFIEKISSLKTISTQIQSVDSNFCGFYCILFCLFQDKITAKSRLPKFYTNANDLRKNDKLCLQYILNCIELFQ